MSNTPQIRFAGFTDAWEQRKLSDMVDRVTRKNENLESELPLTISAQYGLIDQNEFFDKRIASRDVSGYYLLKKGEFAYNKSTSSDAPWGAVKRLDRYEMGVLSTLYIVFALKENGNIDSDFLVSYYDTDCWHKGVQAIAAEGARNHGLLNITPADYFETVLTVPSDTKEQHQIGTFFSKLDTLITLHQREYFPFLFGSDIAKNVQKTISWEQRKLGDMCDEFQSGKSIKASEITDSGEYAVYGGNGFRGYTNTYNHDGDYALIGRQGALCGNMNISSGKAYFTEHAVAVHGNADNDTLFLYYLLDLMNLGQYSGQSAQPGLAVNKIIQLYAKAPKMHEQKQISSFFKQLDNRITLHQHKSNKKDMTL